MEQENRNSFFNKLSKMFSTAVFMRDIGDSKLKVIDIDKVQATSNLATNRLIDRYSRVVMPIRSYGYDYSYANQGTRFELYRDYEQMDMYPILSSALDIMAEEVSMRNLYGNVLEIQSDTRDITDALNNLFYDILNIEFNLFPWARNLCKYGDFWLKLDITETMGITNCIALSPYGMQRVEDTTNPEIVEFRYDPAMGNYMYGANAQTYKNYEVAHFRLLSDSNFLPYGRSIFEQARSIWKQLTLLTDAMLIHKIMRAPERRIYYVDIGNIPSHEVDQHIQNIINNTKKTPYIDENTGQYNLRFNLMNMLEDLYLPVRGDKQGSRIDTLQGLQLEFKEDLDFLLNHMFAAIRVPKAFLNYESDLEGRTTLTTQDIRFARTIERIQRIIESELYKIAIIHLYALGFDDNQLVNFELSLTPSSILYEQERNQLLRDKIDMVNSMKESKLISNKFIYEEIFHFSEDKWKDMQNDVLDDLKFLHRLETIGETGYDPIDDLVNSSADDNQEDIGDANTMDGESLDDMEYNDDMGDQNREEENAPNSKDSGIENKNKKEPIANNKNIPNEHIKSRIANQKRRFLKDFDVNKILKSRNNTNNIILKDSRKRNKENVSWRDTYMDENKY